MNKRRNKFIDSNRWGCNYRRGSGCTGSAIVFNDALVDELKTGLAYFMDRSDFPAAFNFKLRNAENLVAPWARHRDGLSLYAHNRQRQSLS